MCKRFLTNTDGSSVLICKACGRKLKGKRWIETTKQEVAHAELMGDLKYSHCTDCLRHAEGHVAKLQVRGRFSEDIIEGVIEKELGKSDEKGARENAFLKGGDYYFTSKNMLRTVARRLRELGAETQETSKVVTHDRQKSVPLTRLIISAKFNVIPGDVVETGSGFDVVSRIQRGWVWTRGGGKLKVKNTRVVDVERLEGVVVSEKPPLVLIKATNETVEVNHLAGGAGETVEVLRKGAFITTV